MSIYLAHHVQRVAAHHPRRGEHGGPGHFARDLRVQRQIQSQGTYVTKRGSPTREREIEKYRERQ